MKHHQRKAFAETAEDLYDNASESLSDACGEMKDTKKYHFFWGTGSPFSQWTPCRYELNGFEYSCPEQGMMHGKALLFEDYDYAAYIMEATNPREMKKLGQKIRGFKDRVWQKHRERIVYENSMAKFTQNESFKKALLKTRGGLLVEASPHDKIWGIGLHETEARRTPPNKWPGLNLLGKTLTKVRDEIVSQEGERCDGTVG